MHFLSLDAKLMKNKMHPGLLRHLQQNNIVVGTELDMLSGSYDQILGALTDVRWTKKDAGTIMGGTYCLTGMWKSLIYHLKYSGSLLSQATV